MTCNAQYRLTYMRVPLDITSMCDLQCGECYAGSIRLPHPSRPGKSSKKTTIQMETMDRRQTPLVSFFDLPRELRDIIYQHIPDNAGAFTYDTYIARECPKWKPNTIGYRKDGRFFEQKYGNSGVAFGAGQNCRAILLTCRTIYREASPVLYAATPLGLWRPMHDYGGAVEYPHFIAKVFEALPISAGKQIQTLQLQGEFWQKSMQALFSAVDEHLPALKVLEIGLDPYYVSAERRYWFDNRAILRQAWPAIATLCSIAQRLDMIHITAAPPKDFVQVVQDNHERAQLANQQLDDFIWSYLQLSVLKDELTIYGGILHGDAKLGMEFYMERLVERRDLFEIFQRDMQIEESRRLVPKFKIEGEMGWLENITGRVMVVDREKMRITTMSAPDASTKWCKMVYEARPRGEVGSQFSASQ
ncbi:hypothetical protein E4T42_05598 [Aureobasidium subglaciale]|nr:hypothetical protein E4T42_05598 [Aureobasidium subglaciale]